MNPYDDPITVSTGCFILLLLPALAIGIRAANAGVGTAPTEDAEMADKYLVSIITEGLGGGTTIFMCGVFDTRDEARDYIEKRAEYANREPDEYRITPVAYKPKPTPSS